MISFFVNLWHLWRTVVRGFREDAEFRSMMFLLAFLLAGGTLFYWQNQQWGVLDALYFCVMTISTVGYGDLTPTTPFSKIFTMIYAILGIGLFASFVGKLVALRINYRTKHHEKHHLGKSA
jgi:hypothetical protein